MDDNLLEILDKAVEQGGSNLAKSKIAKGKGAAELLQTLCDQGYLHFEKKKYSLTSEGRQKWEEEAAVERVNAVKEQERLAHETAIVELLKIIEKKEGKALSKTELNKYSDQLTSILDEKLTEAGTKKNVYQLTSKGENRLLLQAPVADQVNRLQGMLQLLEQGWEVLHDAVQSNLQKLKDHSDGSMETIANELKEKGDLAQLEFAEAINSTQMIDTVFRAAQKMKESIASMADAALAQMQESKNRENEKQAEQAAIVEQLDQLRQDQQELGMTIATIVESKPDQSSEPLKRSESSRSNSEPPINEHEIWKTVKYQHDQINRMGDVIKIPELSDKIRGTHPELSVDSFHKLLLKWQEEEKLILLVCNDPLQEPRSSEAIESARGLLYYVELDEEPSN